MKKFTLIAIGCMAAFGVSAQQPSDQKAEKKIDKKYCLSVTDGRTSVSEDGKAISSDVTLQYGATLTTAGKILWKDGSSTQLKNGECIDETGATYAATPQTKKESGMTTSADDSDNLK